MKNSLLILNFCLMAAIFNTAHAVPFTSGLTLTATVGLDLAVPPPSTPVKTPSLHLPVAVLMIFAVSMGRLYLEELHL